MDADGSIREVGIAPRPLQNPIPVYSGFTHSLQTSLYWAKEGGKPIVMAGEMDFCFCLLGQGILDRDRCLKTLGLCAEKVMPASAASRSHYRRRRASARCRSGTAYN